MSGVMLMSLLDFLSQSRDVEAMGSTPVMGDRVGGLRSCYLDMALYNGSYNEEKERVDKYTHPRDAGLVWIEGIRSND